MLRHAVGQHVGLAALVCLLLRLLGKWEPAVFAEAVFWVSVMLFQSAHL